MMQEESVQSPKEQQWGIRHVILGWLLGQVSVILALVAIGLIDQNINLDDPSFTYASNFFCQGDTDPLPTITGLTGGSFSAVVGVSINASTGEVDLSASTAGGPYTITYTTART